MNIRTWLNNWLKPANLIAIGLLFVTGFGVFAGTKFLSNNQSITITDECEGSKIKQKTNNTANSNQNLKCDGKSATDINQEQIK